MTTESPPAGEPMRLPPGFGVASAILRWTDVEARVAGSAHYWLATTRQDGRPHVVPIDGLWLSNRFYFGGSKASIRHRNLELNRHAALHLQDAEAPVIVEGVCEFVRLDQPLAESLAEQSASKYGFAPDPSAYMTGLWALRPTRVLAWSRFPADATRFLFAEG